MALVSLAGPVSNLLLAALAFVLLHLLFVGGSFSLGQLLTGGRGTEGVLLTVLQQFLSYSLFVNLALMAFNLLPLAPLDGSKIVTPFVPWEYRRQYDDLLLQGPYILFGLLILGDILGVPLISWWVSFWADLALQIFSLLTPWW
jgi:Zn-dependent protease